MSEPTPIRLAHFSDLHVTAQRLGWRKRDLISKRVTGWLNLRLLGRGYRFRRAAAVAATLAAELRARPSDAWVFSGDATALAFPSEMREAADALGVVNTDRPALAVPGNHDYYTRSAVRLNTFSECFGPWQQGVRVDAEIYPFAVAVGPLWLIGVDSARFNPMTWDARGGVGPEQCERLARLLRELPPGPRILVTHYPLFLPTGKPEARLRRLRDWREVLRIAAEGGVSLWLHGHRHKPYFRPADDVVPFPVVCGGSATQSNLWTYGELTITGKMVHLQRRVFNLEAAAYSDGTSETFELT